MTTQGPPYSVSNSEIGTTHLGVILHLSPFLLGENCNEGFWGVGIDGQSQDPRIKQASFSFTL